MKKYNLLFIIILLFCYSYFNLYRSTEIKAEDNAIMKKAILRVVTSPDYPPFEFLSKGQIVGYDIDLINMIADELSMTAQIQQVPFQSLIAMLHRPDVDLAISSLSINQARLKQVDFSNVYYRNSISILQLKENDLQDLSDCHNKKVAVQTGSVMEQYLKEYMRKNKEIRIDLVTLDNGIVALQELLLKRVSAILIETIQAQYLQEKHGDALHSTLIPIEHEHLHGYAIAFKSGSNLRSSINEVLSRLQEDGRLLALETKWSKKQQ